MTLCLSRHVLMLGQFIFKHKRLNVDILTFLCLYVASVNQALPGSRDCNASLKEFMKAETLTPLNKLLKPGFHIISPIVPVASIACKNCVGDGEDLCDSLFPFNRLDRPRG